MSPEPDTALDRAPGEEREERDSLLAGVRGYVVGLAFAIVLTALSFLIGKTGLIYPPALPMALIALAVAQMGVHLVFFLHVTSGPDNTNNILALAFGVLIVLLVVFGTIWIVSDLNRNMAPMHM